MKKILYLNVKKVWFDLMIVGQKKIEIRVPSQWIKSRVNGRYYDVIKFINGYGHSKPFFICKFLGYEISDIEKIHSFGNIKLTQKKGDYVIKLGNVIETGNLNV